MYYMYSHGVLVLHGEVEPLPLASVIHQCP
jgi:hypothetical protein